LLGRLAPRSVEMVRGLEVFVQREVVVAQPGTCAALMEVRAGGDCEPLVVVPAEPVARRFLEDQQVLLQEGKSVVER
jgi:hypothetical protein